MSKTTSKPKTTAPGSPSPSSDPLDEKISDVAAKTAAGLRRNQIFIFSILGVILAAFLIVSAVTTMQQKQLEEYAADAHRLFSSASSRDADVIAVLPEIKNLLESVRGKPVEKSIHKDAFAYVLGQIEQTLLPISPPSTPEGVAEEPKNNIPEGRLDEVVQEARTILEESRKLFANDAEMQAWAASTLASLDTLIKLGSTDSAPNRGFTPELPSK